MVDVIIAGGGIAGASLAILLARQGLEVKVFDRARFPREKACGEGLMPAGVQALARLGVEIEGAPFAGIRYWHGDESVEGRFPGNSFGLAVRRRHLDEVLLRTASHQPGVHVSTDCRIEAPLVENGRIRGVITSSGGERARLTVGADGANSTLRHKLGWDASGKSRRFGTRSHYHVRVGQAFLLAAGLPPGVVQRRQTICAGWKAGGRQECLPHNWVDVFLEPRREFYVTPLPNQELLVATLSDSKRSTSHLPRRLAELLQHAEPIDEPLGAAPLNVRAFRRHAAGFVLLGDAAGNCDPITGGGMTQALLSSEMLASRLAKAFPPTERDLAAFDAERERMLRDYRRLTAMVLAIAKRKSLIPPALHILRAWPALFSHLIGVAGGVRPLIAWPGSKAA
jgi:menaquinone-9 beta-reductase